MNARTTMMLAGISLLAANPASATTLVTPAIPTGTATSFQCAVVNTGTRDSGPVLFEMIGEAGAVLGSNTFVIPAGAIRSFASAASAGLNYCRVTGISKTRARVTLCTRDASLNCLQNVTIP